MVHSFFRCWLVLLLVVAGCNHFVPEPPESKVSNTFLVEAQEYLSQGKLKDALIILKKAFILEPENEQISLQINRTEKQLFTEAHKLYLEGLRLEKHGRYNKAEQLFKEALTLWPDHGGAKEILSNYSKLQIIPHITHTIQSGDTLSGLAVFYYDDYGKLDKISRRNKFEDAAKLKIGQVIKIPKIEGISLDQLKLKREKYLALTETQISEPEIHVSAAVTQPSNLVNPLPEKIYGGNNDCKNSNIEDSSMNVTKETSVGSPSQKSEETTKPPDKIISNSDQKKEFWDYHWDRKVVWGLNYDQVNRLFKGKLKKKENKQHSFLEYFDLLKTAHAKEKPISYCFIDEPFLLGGCYYEAIFTMDKDGRLIQVTLTSKNRECACHQKAKQALCAIYGEPLEYKDKSFSGVEDYSTSWATEDTVIIKNFSVTSLGKSCNIIYRMKSGW